tara:strand:+ start:269 stop:841 length:573 start_codon:yes stop_codon:yes gene_type:complete
LNKHPEFRDKHDLTHTDVDEEPLKKLKLQMKLDRPLELLDLLRFPMDWVQAYVVKKSRKKVSMLREMLLLIQQDNKAIIQELLDFLVVVEVEKQKVFGLDDVTLTFTGHLPTKELQSIVRKGKKYGYIEDDVVVVRKHYTVKISLEHVILMFSELIETDPDLKEHRDIFKNNEWYLFEKDAPAKAATTNP